LKRKLFAEEEKKLKFRRSIVVNKDLKEGHILTIDDLSFKRPETGIRHDEVRYVIGRVIKNDMSCDDVLYWEDLK
jgi:N-acetylneuraminate synthase